MARRDLDALSSRAGAAGVAVLGVVGHVLPDAVMHFDVRPFAPLTDSNPFYRAVDLETLHWILIGLGIAGAAIIAWRVARA